MSAEVESGCMHSDLSVFRGLNGNKVLKIIKLEDGSCGAYKVGVTYHIDSEYGYLVGRNVECLVSVDNKSDRWVAVPVSDEEVEDEFIDERSGDISNDLSVVEREPQEQIASVMSVLSAIEQSLEEIRGIVRSNSDKLSTLESMFDKFPDEICREVSKLVQSAVVTSATRLSSSDYGVQSSIKENADMTVLMGGDSISSTLFTSGSYSVHYCPGDKTLHFREDGEGGYKPENRIITIPNLRRLTSIKTPRKVDAISSDGNIVISLATKNHELNLNQF